jgi:hypothetical protein
MVFMFLSIPNNSDSMYRIEQNIKAKEMGKKQKEEENEQKKQEESNPGENTFE